MVVARAGRVIAAVKENADLPRWALWLAFWLVLFFGCSMAAALAHEVKNACDLAVLKHVTHQNDMIAN